MSIEIEFLASFIASFIVVSVPVGPVSVKGIVITFNLIRIGMVFGWQR